MRRLNGTLARSQAAERVDARTAPIGWDGLPMVRIRGEWCVIADVRATHEANRLRDAEENERYDRELARLWKEARRPSRRIDRDGLTQVLVDGLDPDGALPRKLARALLEGLT